MELNIDKISKDLEEILEKKKWLDMAYESKMITKEQYEAAQRSVIKPYLKEDR